MVDFKTKGLRSNSNDLEEFERISNFHQIPQSKSIIKQIVATQKGIMVQNSILSLEIVYPLLIWVDMAYKNAR